MLVILLSPILKLQHALLPRLFTFPFFKFKLTFESIKELGSASKQVMEKFEHIDSMFDIAQKSPLDDDFSSYVSTVINHTIIST
jgi:hypothetical protein